MTRPAALGAGGEAPRRSVALGLLLGLRRRAVLLAVLLLGRGVRRADDGHVDAGREDGEDRRDDELDEEEPARGGTPFTSVVRLVRAIDATAGSSDAAADAATVFARGFESFQCFFVALYSEPKRFCARIALKA